MLPFQTQDRLWTGLQGRTTCAGPPVLTRPLPETGWFENRVPANPSRSAQPCHPHGAEEPLFVVVYDISDVRRWRRVAKHCENFGVRVQYSLFECRLPLAEFARFWDELQKLIEPRADRLVVYQLCEHCVGIVRTAGCMARPLWEKVEAIIV